MTVSVILAQLGHQRKMLGDSLWRGDTKRWNRATAEASNFVSV